MTARSLWIAAGCAAVLAFAQDQEAPPAIEQWGISNAASRMPLQLPAGGVARGSLIRIRGWRLGPAEPASIAVRIRRGETRVQARTLAAGENEIEALVPQEAPLGRAMLQVVKNGNASLEWPVAIVASSFGAFARNGRGWGPGEITNAGGTPNSETRPARPGEMVMLAGTGLGVRTTSHRPQVLVAGRLAKTVRLTPIDTARPGVDAIEFALPEDAPEGCYVPVQVSSAPGFYSNAVTLSISRTGAPCADPGDWIGGASRRTVRMGNVTLLHADLLLEPMPRKTVRYPVDAGFASFSEIEPGALASPLFLFPPPATCTIYSGTVSLHSLASPLSMLQALPGTPLDAGPAVAVEGTGGNRSLPPDRSHRNYWAVIGGHSPMLGARDLPLFLTPGEYQVSTPGGPEVGAFHARVRIASPLVWRNREQLAEVDRARGATVSWRSAATGAPAFVLIVAMNADAISGATGVCVCLTHAADGSFHIPAYALANLPPSPAHPRGFPLNLMLLVELPEIRSLPAAGTDVDRILSFAASISGRTVRFK